MIVSIRANPPPLGNEVTIDGEWAVFLGMEVNPTPFTLITLNSQQAQLVMFYIVEAVVNGITPEAMMLSPKRRVPYGLPPLENQVKALRIAKAQSDYEERLHYDATPDNLGFNVWNSHTRSRTR